MATMTLAIPDELKKEMDSLSIINWSAVAREAFSEKITKLKLLESLTKDSRLTDKDIEELGKKIKAGIAEAHNKYKNKKV
ncbi:hypothetical protein AUJ13_04920 [Candidatus Micrarchaeota archaeon CG1_02_49_24]|nr:MAG: hypothetical protein AUJ13_04920 [Candidatus Micrarchaeota archaeon CG1_02_49_24]HII53652.1 hypothetical protein [Candidatus Micrarchaeota archaeon]